MNEKDPIAAAPAPSTSDPAIIAVELAPSDTPIDDDEVLRRAIEQIWWEDNFEAFATPLRNGDFSQAEGQLAEVGYVRKANSNVGLEPIFDIQMTSALGRQLGLLNLSGSHHKLLPMPGIKADIASIAHRSSHPRAVGRLYEFRHRIRPTRSLFLHWPSNCLHIQTQAHASCLLPPQPAHSNLTRNGRNLDRYLLLAAHVDVHHTVSLYAETPNSSREISSSLEAAPRQHSCPLQ